MTLHEKTVTVMKYRQTVDGRQMNGLMDGSKDRWKESKHFTGLV